MLVRLAVAAVFEGMKITSHWWIPLRRIVLIFDGVGGRSSKNRGGESIHDPHEGAYRTLKNFERAACPYLNSSMNYCET